MVGCGNVSTRFHLPAYLARNDRFRVVALADPSAERLEEARSVAGLSDDRCFADVDDLVRRPDVDVVDICSPQRSHREVALAAAAAGKHILTEKPIATVPGEAVAMIDAARRAGVTLGVMHNYLFFPELLAAHRIVASGELGDVRTVVMNFLGVPDLPGADPAGPSWRHDLRSAGGGVLMDMLHVLYVAEDLLGLPVERVSAHVSAHGSQSSVEALATCRLETEQAVALVNVGWGIGPGGIVVAGDEGWLEIRYRNGATSPFEPFDCLVVTTAAGRRLEPLAPGQATVPLVIDAIGGVLDDFAQALLDGRAPIADGAAGLHVLELTLAAYESATLGSSVAVPLGESDPVFLRGAAGVRELDGPEWTSVHRQKLFGVASEARR